MENSGKSFGDLDLKKLQESINMKRVMSIPEEKVSLLDQKLKNGEFSDGYAVFIQYTTPKFKKLRGTNRVWNFYKITEKTLSIQFDLDAEEVKNFITELSRQLGSDYEVVFPANESNVIKVKELNCFKCKKK